MVYMYELSIVVLAAGKSSRFGGEPKLLSKVGQNKETLLEVSLTQIQNYFKINKLCIVLGPHNTRSIQKAIEEMNLVHKLNCELVYTLQDEARGTAHALNTIYEKITTAFLLLNSDDLYGEATFEMLSKCMDKGDHYVIGYPIGETLKDTNPANRAFIQCNQEYNVSKLQEKLQVRRSFYSPNELNEIIVSVNLFYLQPEVLNKLKLHVERVLEDECFEGEIMLPSVLNTFIEKHDMTLKCLKSAGEWLGVTYKDDVKSVKQSLKSRK